MPPTKHRMVRVSDELWEATRKAAEQNGETISDVVRSAMERYVRATNRRANTGGTK